MRFHIYSGDVCIGDVDNANNEDHALALYAFRTGMDNVIGLTPVRVLDFAPVTEAIMADDLASAFAALDALERML